ncbi:hypothetical protein DUI87_25063 [Hirundo rustica rustica]|uniref:Uncharacterized protein n=1 Tax=Hirundo rustica rustica TaxID=333673 RepID=A0A3M0JDE6_HIRRU|nr:hypothetical protein DUI87_25063 [Hirundo rustica rustica]
MDQGGLAAWSPRLTEESSPGNSIICWSIQEFGVFFAVLLDFGTHFLLCHQFNVIHYQEYSLYQHISACERNANANLENAQGV